MDSTTTLFETFTTLIGEYGVNSKEVANYVELNNHNMEFVELAQLTCKLKKALTTSQHPSTTSSN